MEGGKTTPKATRTHVKTSQLPKARERRVTKSRLVWVLDLIGRDDEASFLDQSPNKIKQSCIVFKTIENRPNVVHWTDKQRFTFVCLSY